jgi:hypothetical protein
MEATQARLGEGVVEASTARDFHALVGSTIPASADHLHRIAHLIVRRAKTHGYDVPSRLYQELSARATDPRDIVYGLREIFDPVFRRVFVPDYSMRAELLFACLAVYLIQFESWGDALWWYPARFTSKLADEKLPSWLADFSRRITPTVYEPVPHDPSADTQEDPKLVVLSHRLRAEGYKLDVLYGHRHLDKADGQKILEELWQFDTALNYHHPCHEHTGEDKARGDAWFDACARMYREGLAKRNSNFVPPSQGSILQDTAAVSVRHEMPEFVSQCIPCWDILIWHALGNDEAGISPRLVEGQQTSRRLLHDIFSARMDDAFRTMFAEFFVAACLLDWPAFKIFLDRFSNAPMWSQDKHDYWKVFSADDMSQRTASITEAYTAYMSHVWTGISRVHWCYPFYYTYLAYAILLDCDDQASIARLVGKLQDAAGKLRAMASSPDTSTLVTDLAHHNAVVARRVRSYDAVVERFKGRFLVWTDRGLHGVACPGWDNCPYQDNPAGAEITVLVADGLSFPVLVQGFDEATGEGRLLGCVVLEHIDMSGRDAEKMKEGLGYDIGERRVFEFV